jgi:hypothetical protein
MFDPRRNFQLQGFTGRGATTTIHDASETDVSISGIFQGAEDFAVLGLYDAYDYYAHLRCKHLPRTDLSGVAWSFDIEYDHDLDGAMRLDAAKYPSVAWDALTFVCGKGVAPDDIYEVKLTGEIQNHYLDGEETPAKVAVEISGAEILDGGIDWLHLHFRDTRYTVTSTDCRAQTLAWMPFGPNIDTETGVQTYTKIDVISVAAFTPGDTITIERTGTNEETTTVIEVGVDEVSGPYLLAWVTKSHTSDVYITRETRAIHVAQKLADIINTYGATVAGRFGPDYSQSIKGTAGAGSTYQSGTLYLEFLSPEYRKYYGKLGNLDRILVTHGRTIGGVPDAQQGFLWTDGSGYSPRFTGGDNTIRQRIYINPSHPSGFKDKLGRLVPMNDCRKIYMVLAPRFERTEEQLEDGCFLTAPVNTGDATWQVDDSSKLTGGRYFIGTPTSEERIFLLGVDSPTQIRIQRAYEGSIAGSWLAGARLKKLSPKSGFGSDVEWRVALSNFAIDEGDASLKVGGGSPRIEESEARCRYTGYWEDYKYATGWPSQWWAGGHAKRTAPSDANDERKVVLSYSHPEEHDLYLGTFLYTNCGKIRVDVDGVTSDHDLYLSEYEGRVASIKVRGGMAAGNHTVTITALFEKHASSTGYYFYFDYLWPIDPQDVPDAPKMYPDVSLAIDFDTDHGYKKPPAWHLWQLQKLGFKGHADVYMGVFWNNKRQRVGASYPHATVAFAGTPAPGDTVSISIGGSNITHAIGYGETLQELVSHMRATINGMFAGVWADDNFGTSTTLRIQSKAPGYTFTIAVTSAVSVSLTLTDHLGAVGTEGDWELLDSVSPVMTEGARKWIRDLAGQFQAAGIPASFAFSMEVYNPPAAMRAKYLRLNGGVVQPGNDVYLEIPSHQMHFGTRVRNYLRQMYKECADQIAAAGLPVVLQFGETQWWYFDNRAQDPLGGMSFYDQETIDAFAAAKGHQIWPFTSNLDDPAGDSAHPYETADFLRDRIGAYCQDVIAYVRGYHPAAVFECLWPLDANQGKPSPDPAYRRLLMHVNLPNQWKNSSYGIKYFRCEGFDYDIWQKNVNLMAQTISYASKTLGRPAGECMYLAGLYGPPDPPLAQAYGLWLQSSFYSMCFWAFDQFCLNARPVPLPAWVQSSGTAAVYHKPRAARAVEVVTAVEVVASAGGALNRFALNERRLNG